MLTDIAGYLVTQTVCTAIGTDLFILEVPQYPDLCTMVFQYAGSPAGLTFDGAAEDRLSLQVRTRGSPDGLVAAEARAKAAQTALHGVANTTISSTFYQSIQALGGYMFIGNDEQGRPEFTQNFAVVKVP